MVNAPSVSLKIIVIAHFVLTVWASMVGYPFLGASYIYMNAFVLAFGIWAIISPESVESAFMFMILNLVCIVMDIIFLGIFTPKGHNVFEVTGLNRDLYRFSLGMAIVNLICRPFSSFVLYRISQDRGGQYSDFGIPGIPGLPGFGGPNERQSGGGYEDIDHSVPGNDPRADKSPLTP